MSGGFPRGLCQHCGRFQISRARRLCYNCSLKPEVRALYPTVSRYTNRGHGLTASGKLPPEPTMTLPGTVERVAALEERARRGLALWHPDDARPDME